MNDTIVCPGWSKTYSSSPVQQVYWSYMITCALTIVLSIPATALNLLVITAIIGNKALHKPSYMLLCSLAIADFGTGILAQPLYTSHILVEIMGNVDAYCVTGAVTAVTSYTFAGASLFTLAAISVDRCLAINQPLRYRAVVTSRAVIQISVVLWVLAAVGASTRLYLSITYFMFSLASVMGVSLTAIFFSNIQAFGSLRKQKRRTVDNMTLHQGQHAVKLASFRKYLITMLYVLGLIMLCYIPFVCVTVITALSGVTRNTRAAWNIADSIGYMNSSLNPLVYCFRIPEINSACKRSLQKLGVGFMCCDSYRVTPVVPSSQSPRTFNLSNPLEVIREEGTSSPYNQPGMTLKVFPKC